MNIYETASMLEALKLRKRPTTFLRDTFFPLENKSLTKKIQLDIVKGKRRTAPYVKRTQAATVVARDSMDTNSYEVPFISLKRPLSAEDVLDSRVPGQNLYGATLDQVMAYTLGKDLAELDDMVTRAEELQAMQGLFDGKVTLTNGDEIDFLRDSNHTVTLSGVDRWDQSTGKPFSDFKAWRRLIAKDSDVSAAITVMGSEAFEAFVSNAQVMALLDKLRINLGAIIQENLPSGVTYYGNLPDIGHLFTYDGFYLDANGDEQPIVPEKKVLISADGNSLRGRKNYGAIFLPKLNTLFAEPRVPDTFEKDDPPVKFLRMQSAPLLVPENIDGAVVAQVVS